MCAHIIFKICFFFSLQATSASTSESVNYFLKNATAFLDLVDYNILPTEEGLSDLLKRFEGTSAGNLQVKDPDALRGWGVAKFDAIGNNSLIHFITYLPVKFDEPGCTKKIEPNELPAFYTEMISASLPAQPKTRNEKK